MTMFENLYKYAVGKFLSRQGSAYSFLSLYGMGAQVRKQAFMELEKIALRTLILDIHRKKEAGVLSGQTSGEQYRYYNEVWLGEASNIESLFAEFPELRRLLFLELERVYSAAEEICARLETDREEIRERFCGGENFVKIAAFDFRGDSHKGGKRAARIKLDNGTVLYYKPHTLLRNEQYQEIYGYLCRSAGISCKKVRYLSRETYGWEENIENQSCSRKEEVEAYYFRIGIHLFLGYALSATDLHGENIIACGEHPVIIDMETFPGYAVSTEESSAEKKIEKLLAGSVLRTGMLPVLSWGKAENAVLVSAIGNGDTVVTPFSLPVVKNRDTADVCIQYETINVKIKECVVKCGGKTVCAGDYARELTDGFRAAYGTVLKDEKARELLEVFFDGRARIILRHTQQYAMYQILSFHPELMGDGERRRKILGSLHREGDTEQQRRIKDCEIDGLMDLDIPYFEMEGDSRCLYGDGERCFEDYFSRTPREAWEERMRNLSEKDMEDQCGFIRLSMAMLEKSSRASGEVTRSFSSSEKTEESPAQIGKMISRLCGAAITAGEDIGWAGLKFYHKNRWSLKPVDLYLYGGIAGITLVLAKYQQLFPDEKAGRIFSLAAEKMMSHTDALAKTDRHEKVRTGLLEGEGSFVPAYLFLYDITKDDRYLLYAGRHYKAMEPFIWQDGCPDYLSGIAGAGAAAVLLFQRTGEKEYLLSAVKTEKRLWAMRKEQNTGVGWILENMERPLAGMAHGGSGILIFYCGLYEATGEKEYLQKAKAVMDYEDSLFSEELGNWLDLRAPEKDARVMNAWCHGAPGILLARLRLAKITDDKQASVDIERCVKALFEKTTDQQLCLCHGLAGNLLIMREYLKHNHDQRLQEIYENYCEEFLSEAIEVYDSHNNVEFLNPAFMNGLSGIIYALMILYEDAEAPGY